MIHPENTLYIGCRFITQLLTSHRDGFYKIKSLTKTDAEYESTLVRIEEIMDALPNTPEGDELQLLSVLVEKYENDNYPLPEADPIDVIQYFIEQRGLKAKDLVGIIGDKAIVSKVMNRERKLNLRMVRNLHQKAKIPYSLLIKEY